ncbi:MAG: SRPBCC family protein [Actinobacteria bacterium]|nr:SRPBCC family protein [Actinomycetota bacterium]
MITGTATITIDRPPQQVWAAITDITRMGDWSPECIAARWAGGATGAALGAKFEGDNEVRIAGRVAKRWTTTSTITACTPTTRFEFNVEGYTTWSYDLQPVDGGTRVTEKFQYESKGFKGFVYRRVLLRQRMMRKGMQRTLARVKAALEQ